VLAQHDLATAALAGVTPASHHHNITLLIVERLDVVMASEVLHPDGHAEGAAAVVGHLIPDRQQVREVVRLAGVEVDH
jgi:hypothetical protein